MQEIKPNFKLQPNELFISSSLLNNIIKSTNIKKAILEETTSELWYETLHGYGNVTFKNNIQYSGNLRYGILSNEDPEKPCTIIFPNGTKYTGTMLNNEITGVGEYIFSNGSTYTGSVLNGLRDGEGIFQSIDGIIYEGEWKRGLKHGKGKIVQGNMELEGEWKEGVICGKCRIQWKSGNLFEGELADNKLNGNGYMVWNDKNEKYTGRWENNLQSGLGIHIWYDNKLSNNKFFRDRYVGQWKEGMRDGYGKFFYSNGSIYEGYWKNDKKEGFGILYFQDRTKISGIFKNDILINNLQNKVNNLNNQTNSPKNESKKKSPLKNNKSNRRASIKSNMSSDTSRFIDNNMSKLEVLKEGKKEDNQEKNENEEVVMNKTRQKSFKDKKERIMKNIDEVKIPISLADFTILEPIEKKTYKELDNLILRNLSLITHLYMYACGKEDIKSSDIGLSTASPSMISEPKSMFKQQLQVMKKEQNSKEKNILDDNIALQNEEKKEKVIDYDNIYNNDLYFSLDFKSYWRLLRECGLITPTFSLAMVNRIIFQNPENEIEMFFIPEELEKLNKNKETFDTIYDYIYQKILNSKNIFDIKYRSQIEQGSFFLYNSLPQGLLSSSYMLNDENEKKEKIYYLNYHDEKNIILLRYFYEILIRLAITRFSDEEELSMEGKVKKLFDLLRVFFRMRRKTGIDASVTAISIVDPKLRNFEAAQELFIENHYQILKNIFVDLYKYSCNSEKSFKYYDMTITYQFFYDKIILNSEKLSELFEDKLLYIDLISLFYKEKKIFSNNIDFINLEDMEIFEYLESLYQYEMIFREFCELIFNISRKYFHFFEIDTEYEDNKGIIMSKEEERKRDEDRKLTKRKKKKNKNKNEDIYMIVIDEIIKANNKLKEKKDKNKGINKYYYPILKTHIIIEKIKEEEEQKKLEEEKREKEIKRYEYEREIFKEEDINIYKGEEVKEENTDSGSLSDY